MSETPILVLGGTGKTGRRVAHQLAEHGRSAKIASRSGGQHFDWQDESTWAPAVDGVEAAYLVDSQGEDAAQLLAEFARLAARKGVKRLVLLSARMWEQWEDESIFATERAVQDSGAGWTVLRPTWFAQNFSEDAFWSDAVIGGEVVLPTWNGLEPFIDAEDIAAVVVAALTEDGHDGATYALSGPRLMTFGDCVEEIAKAAGRDIRQVTASGLEYVEHLVGRGYPRDYAEFANQLFYTIREGRSAYLSDGVQRVLDREPRDFSAYVAATVPTGVWNL